MRRRRKQLLIQVCSFCLTLSIFMVQASAIMKEIGVGGAYSINDLGQSDNRVTMDQLKEDYLPFKRTDWLTEYFHRDQEDPSKTNLGEAASWLVDHEIINRDAEINVTNVRPADYTGSDPGLPSISIRKTDLSDFSNKAVHRSDMIMYLYKAVFGSIDARVIGIETPNIRVDEGTKKRLYKMMDDHGYWATIQGTTQTIVNQGTHNTTNISTTGGATVNQSTAGQQISSGPINTSSRWRYTPQGDEYESMFGDTNIFVSDVDISQQGNTGTGSQTSGFIDNEAHTSNNDNSITGGDASFTQGSYNRNTTGNINSAVAYETDYKQIYYVPGCDLMFYRADDCLELYLQYAISKGLLSDDEVDKTEKYDDVFINNAITDSASEHTVLNIWSPAARPHIVNQLLTRYNRDISNVRPITHPAYARMDIQSYGINRQHNVLGDNYAVTVTSNADGTISLRITRRNLFASNSGYFDSEQISRMQFYEYIYRFLNGSEKKLSDLEIEIINYKYGTQLETLGNDDEVHILKYLVAAGILDYTDSYDFRNLNDSITYSDFLPILYRVANADARLDFSKVQLTDSEAQWKDLGYSQKHVVLTNQPSTKITGAYDNSDDTDSVSDIPLAMVAYSADGIMNSTSDDEVDNAVDLLNTLVFEEGDDSVHTLFRAPNYGARIETATSENNVFSSVEVHDLTFGFKGCYVAPGRGAAHGSMRMYSISNKYFTGERFGDSDDNYWQNVISYYISTLLSDDDFMAYWAANANDLGGQKVGGIRTAVRSVTDSIWNTVNPNGLYDYGTTPFMDMKYNFLNNIFVIAMIQNNDIRLSDIQAFLQSERDSVEANYSGGMWAVINGEARRKEAALILLQYIEDTIVNNVSGADAPLNIRFYLNSSTNEWGGGVTGSSLEYRSPVDWSGGSSFQALRSAVENLERIEFDYRVNGEANGEHHTFTRTSDFERQNAKLGDSTEADTPADIWEAGDTRITWSYSMQSSDIKSTNDAVSAISRSLSRGDYDESYAKNASLDVQAPSESNEYGGFISWSDIDRLKSELHIEQMNECILHNTVTDTYAYFPPDDVNYKYAIVGNAVVEGSPDEGTAKTMNGQRWYWYDAIRLLIGVQYESSILGGIEGLTLPPKSVELHAKNIPVTSESGFQGSSLNTIRIRLGKTEAFASAPTGSDEHRFAHTQLPYNGYVWGNFVAGSTSNRVLNMVCRKVSYQKGDNPNDKQFGFALVFLKPTEVGGTSGITDKMSLEETLDSIAKPPDDEAAKAEWLKNKQLCNDFLNWIYHTNNQEFMNTGYLVPEVYVYAESVSDGKSLPKNAFGNITPEMLSMINFKSLNLVHGQVDDPGYTLEGDEADWDFRPAVKAQGNLDTNYLASYYVGEDCRVAVIGDRIFVNEAAIPNLSGYYGVDTSDNNKIAYRYKIVNQAVKSAAFYPGRSIYAGLYKDTFISDDVYTPKITVVSIDDGGKVKAQIGPLMGLPCRINGEIGVIPPSWVVRAGQSNANLLSLVENKDTNLWKYTKEVLLSGYMSGITWNDKICDYPILSLNPSGQRYGVFNGSSIKIYSGDSSRNSTTEYQCGVLGMQGTEDYNTFRDNTLSAPLMARGFSSREAVKYIETYAEIEFSAYDFTVKNDCLIPIASVGGLQSGDVFSPTLFTSINDLIIEEMIATSRAAIPLNQVPQGGLVQIGEGWYIAVNADENDKKFAGYAPLDGFTTRIYNPKIQDAALSMANHFVRGGNQYINITHYITDLIVLNDKPDNDETSYRAWIEKMKPLAETKMKDNTLTNRPRLACPSLSTNQYKIDTGEVLGDSSSEGFHYAPILLQFSDALLAYPISPNGETKVYKICNFTDSAMSGALNNVSFFASDVMNDRLHDVTTTVVAGGYTPFEGARYLMDAFKEEFDRAFAGDLLTLLRLILFIILVWLFLMSWVCYAFYYSRLMPMVDALCHPTNDRSYKGIDLFKLFSFGTISVDTDFKLGRFLQYDFIIAILMLLVWKSGNITF